MNKTLLEYIHNPQNPMSNFYLALWYETEGHYSPACSFYLRTIQFTDKKYLIYECLLRMYFCFDKLGSRDRTSEHLLKSAINTIPECPYAYYLLCKLYEKQQNWMDMYTFSNLCINTCNFNTNKLYIDINFPGKYSIVFYKALSAWWYGKSNESRSIFQELMTDYIDDLNLEYYNLIQNNISKIGTGPKSQSSVTYTSDDISNIKFYFNGIEKINNNFSQVMQDMFVLLVHKGKSNGTYLEIGSSHPFLNNNTALLEQLGWSGIGIEINKDLYNQYKTQRKNHAVLGDATSMNYKKILQHYLPNQKTIDYLQLDIEPCKNTFETLLSIPFDIFKFGVITYEHDYYIDMTRSFRDKSRNYLSSLGYVLLLNDISTDNNSSFEDWWIHPDLMSDELRSFIATIDLDSKVNPIKNIFFK